ncbi:MAG: hypothetical protein EXX96DRAFT_617388 [Benjaminiella poitrasii]|nr:MAG: hypothetical protein EXX96DRAFT_617388 [Benjaminiella poitrasii]
MSKIYRRSEASFLNHYLMPYIELLVLEETDNVVIYSLRPKKPDYLLGIENRRRELYFVYVELNRTACNNNNQEENDIVKLSKLMKASVDDQEAVEMENPISLRLMCEGFTCNLNKMRHMPSNLRKTILAG